jgi:hypothetical protein
MKAYEVVLDGEVMFATVDAEKAKECAAKWQTAGRNAACREQVVAVELSDLVSLCHQMNIERVRGRRGVEGDVFAEIMAICCKCKP